MEVLGGEVIRLKGEVYHFWHPTLNNNGKTSSNNQLLWERYRAAETPEDIDLIIKKNRTISTNYNGATFSIFLQDHRKDEFIHSTIASIVKHVKSNYELILVDDSRDADWRESFKASYPDITVFTVQSPGGYQRSMKLMVDAARHRHSLTGNYPVFWQGDLEATDDIDFNKYLSELLANDRLSQVALIRPLVYDNEFAEGDLIKAQEKRIIDFRGYGSKVMDGNLCIHDFGWTDLISVINPSALETQFPDGMNGEYNYGQLHLQRGLYSSWFVEEPRYKHNGNHNHKVY